MSFRFACRQPLVKWSNIESCMRFCTTGVGPLCFPIRKRYRFPAPPSCTIATYDVIGVFIHHINPLKPSPSDGPKCHVSLMARNSLLPVSEIRTLKIWRRQKSLGCGTAYQLLPRRPTSEIHGLSWKPLLHAPQGVRRSSTTSPRVCRGCHQGGSLAIGIVRFTVTPLVTGGWHTHSQTICSKLDDGL